MATKTPKVPHKSPKVPHKSPTKSPSFYEAVWAVFVGCLIDWLVGSGWLVGCLAAWLLGLISRLLGWLAGRLVG